MLDAAGYLALNLANHVGVSIGSTAVVRAGDVVADVKAAGHTVAATATIDGHDAELARRQRTSGAGPRADRAGRRQCGHADRLGRGRDWGPSVR